MTASSYNKIIIDLKALAANFQSIQTAVGPNTQVLAMVKADAYGHGLIPAAQALSAAGAGTFGVAEIAEGIALRQARIAGTVLVFLGSTDADSLIDHQLTPVVFDLDNIRHLSAVASGRQTSIDIHLKIDVGMGRFGVLPQDVPGVMATIRSLPGVHLAGVLGHFPKADQDTELTNRQNQEFSRLREAIPPSNESRNSVVAHIANSAAILGCPDAYHDLVRPGIALYGCPPSDAIPPMRQLDLAPVMSFETVILQIKEVPDGYGVSYGHLHVTKRRSRLATLPVGYANGYLRCLTDQAQVLIHGQRAAVCGRICMNACVVDITDIPEARVGDRVVLMGRQAGRDGINEISATEIAGWMHTIHYEVLCLFGQGNPREYQDTI